MNSPTFTATIALARAPSTDQAARSPRAVNAVSRRSRTRRGSMRTAIARRGGLARTREPSSPTRRRRPRRRRRNGVSRRAAAAVRRPAPHRTPPFAPRATTPHRERRRRSEDVEPPPREARPGSVARSVAAIAPSASRQREQLGTAPTTSAPHCLLQVATTSANASSSGRESARLRLYFIADR